MLNINVDTALWPRTQRDLMALEEPSYERQRLPKVVVTHSPYIIEAFPFSHLSTKLVEIFQFLTF